MNNIEPQLLNYIRLTSNEDVRDICRSKLTPLGITYFLYVIDLKDGRRFWLTNSGEWEEHYFRQQYYKTSHFEDLNKQYTVGYHLWSTLSGQAVYNDARHYFNIAHGITAVSELKNAYEFVHFGTTRDNAKIINFYLNHIDLLNQFILFFRDKGAALIKMAKENMVALPPTNPQPAKLDLVFPNKNHDIQKLNSTLSPIKHCLSSTFNNAIITAREMECISCLKQGKTANEIGAALNISKRTVDTHLENIKRKLHCKNLFQLGYMISQIGTNKI